MPKSRIDDLARCDTAGVPQMARTAQTKPEISLDEIDCEWAAAIRFGCVSAEVGYEMSVPFRQGLSARGVV